MPVSGIKGDNLIARSGSTAWFGGPTLLAAIDALESPSRPSGAPLRVVLQSVHKVSGIGTVAVGRVESGVLEAGAVDALGGKSFLPKMARCPRCIVQPALPSFAPHRTVRVSVTGL